MVTVVCECMVVTAGVLLGQAIDDSLEMLCWHRNLPNVSLQVKLVLRCLRLDHDDAGAVLLGRDYCIAELHLTGLE
jgi:hypothetical protein